MAGSEEISIAGEVERLASQQPFLPFSIIMASGREYYVSADVSVASGRSTVSLHALKGNNSVLELRQISELVIERELT